MWFIELKDDTSAAGEPAMTNPYCDALGIELPRLERVRNHPEATTFSLLIVALLERDGPMTLGQVAERFEQAGVGRVEEVLRSLRCCRPARPPVWRDGDRYGLDPHDAELDLRVFMLGLRPPRFSPPIRPQPAPLPKPDQRLTLAELDEAWKNAPLYSLSRQRLVLAVLDVHDEPMAPEKVISFVAARTGYHGLTADSTKFKRKGSSVEVRTDGAACSSKLRRRSGMIRHRRSPRRSRDRDDAAECAPSVCRAGKDRRIPAQSYASGQRR
jgi:hypothetical protein